MKIPSVDIAAGRHRRPTSYRFALAVCGILFLAGCSSVPDAVNPVEWYKGARDIVSGDEKAEAAESGKAENNLVAERGQAAPGADEPTPKLTTVPDRPVSTTRAERDEIREGLVADRQQTRRYSSEVIARQGGAVNPLQPAAPPVMAEKPKPKVATPPVVASAAPQVQTPAIPTSPPVPVMSKPVSPPAPVAATRPPPVPQIKTPGPARIVPAPTVATAASTPTRRPAVMAQPRSQRSISEDQGTIIVSSAGVQGAGIPRSQRQLISARPPIAASRPGQSSRVGGVRPLSEFNPSAGQGSYQVATILFKNGSARLGARDRQIIRQIAAQHKQVGGTIRVVGHASHRTKLTDLVSHKIANLRISTSRAEAVARELVELGARPSNLYIGAASDSEPRYLEHMPSGEAGNRRADIYIDF